MKSILPKSLDAVFLDFDGVVVESSNIKTQAFYEIYLPYGVEVAKHARDFHVENQGVSRYKKFAAIHRQYLNKECTSEESENLSNMFSDIVLQKIMTCPFVEGAIGFLDAMKAKKIPVFLLSATPHVELVEICNKRQIENYFTGMFGAPNDKKVIGAELIHEYKFDKNKIIFVGDSVSDWRAANAIQVPFIGRVMKNDQNNFEKSIPIIEDFRTLME